MAEALGIAGSAAGLLSLAIQLAATTNTIIDTVRTAPKAWNSLVSALDDLHPVLRKLQSLPEDRTQEALKPPLANLRKLLVHLQKCLVEIRRTRKYRFRLKWLMRKEEVQQMVMALERQKTTLLLVIGELQLETTMKYGTSLESSSTLLLHQLNLLGVSLEEGNRGIHGHLSRVCKALLMAQRNAERGTANVVDARLRMLLVKLRAHDRRRVRARAYGKPITMTQQQSVLIGSIAEEEFRLVMRNAASGAAPLALALCLIFFDTPPTVCNAHGNTMDGPRSRGDLCT